LLLCRELAAWIALTVMVVMMSLAVSAANTPSDQVVVLVQQIQKADYEGDRATLKQRYADLAPFMSDKQIASRVAYWRGFALWRRALNGFNDKADSTELAADLQQAVTEFKKSAELDPNFVDAKVGEISCLSNLMYVYQKDPAKVGELLGQVIPLTKDAKAADPDNPRLMWVLGANQWYSPVERGGGQAKALETYQKGLEAARRQQASTNPLDPTWGEPELLMNLAWANLNKTTPDPAVAQQDAQAALKLVPYWHYVRDILLVQIQAANKSSH
jgi:hypothetical protein